MKTNTELLKIAQKHLGQGGNIFRRFCGLPAGAAWCNAFVSYVAHEGGDSSIYFDGKRETYCPHSIAWCRKNLAQIPLYLAMPMDIIYFDWEKNGVPNHIGFVRGHRSADSIFTIEGNTDGGRVAQKTRAGKYVQAVYRPHFAPKGLKKSKLTVDGDFGYHSIFMLQVVLGLVPTGVLTKSTVKALQKRAKTAQDGVWLDGTSKAVQRLIGVKADGVFGQTSVKGLQRWINAQFNPQPKETYPGELPKLPPKTAKLAVECAYSYGTKLSRYSYKDGKPKAAYKILLNQVYPNRSRWKYAKSRAGASCDVFAGTILRGAGYAKAPHAMSKMVGWCSRHLKKVSSMQNGDVLTRVNHVMICVDIKGKKLVANAHYQTSGGTYGIIQGISKYTNIWRPAGLSYFSKGDTFTDVKKLKMFLNWYGDYGLAETYSFGDKTEAAVMDFQAKQGLKQTGRFGSEELIKAKNAHRP